MTPKIFKLVTLSLVSYDSYFFFLLCHSWCAFSELFSRQTGFAVNLCSRKLCTHLIYFSKHNKIAHNFFSLYSHHSKSMLMANLLRTRCCKAVKIAENVCVCVRLFKTLNQAFIEDIILKCVAWCTHVCVCVQVQNGKTYKWISCWCYDLT